jgi:hypothetical protein
MITHGLVLTSSFFKTERPGLNIKCCLFWFMVFNATFNNISVISWRSVLLVEETRVPGENHRQTLPHNVVVEML